MRTILLLLFGMLVITSVQIDAICYSYIMSRSSHIRTPFNLVFTPFKRRVWRLVFSLAGLWLLFMAARSSLREMSEYFPQVVSLIGGFLLWIGLVRISTKFFLRSPGGVGAGSIAMTFILPLVLVSLICVSASLYPGIYSIINK